ncbi:MAG: hypothetical protein KJ667_05385 [Alphaproteobacteria bacterium]|nr:hypothetical protein [Alphaproteobacteria bacterium]
MSEMPEDKNTAPVKTQAQKVKSALLGGAGAIGLVGAFCSVATFPFWQESVVASFQGAQIDRVQKLATEAGAQAMVLCASNDVAAQTYDVLSNLYENRVIMRFAPYSASGLADTLAEMTEKNIAVRAPTNQSALAWRTHAVFVKGGNGVDDTLVVGPLTVINDLAVEFMDQVLAQSETMQPGAALVLDSEYVQGEHVERIVPMAAGAAAYVPPAANGNPFTAAVPLNLPKAGCRPF